MFLSDRDFYGFCFILILAGVMIGGVLFVVLPWFWDYIKPWLHTLTA